MKKKFIEWRDVEKQVLPDDQVAKEMIKKMKILFSSYDKNAFLTNAHILDLGMDWIAEYLNNFADETERKYHFDSISKRIFHKIDQISTTKE